MRRLIARENLLRSLYELSEPQLPDKPFVTMEQLTADRAWNASEVRKLLRWGANAGFVERSSAGARLTAAGHDRAEEVVRTHRLWELFLILGADIAPDHVDRDADSIEHFLTPELVSRLEAELAAEGRLPAPPGAVPGSPHEMPAANAAPRGEEASRG